jgi:hypothetical protein
MRYKVRFLAALVVAATLALCFGTRVQAQSTASPTAGNGTYIAIDPLANVRYDNRYDISLGAAYQHVKAGPNVLEGANLGGLNLTASYWLSKHWALEGTGRVFYGTSGVGQTTPVPVKGPVISEYFGAAGPEWLGPHNKHGALIAHVLVGGAYGNFEQDLGPYKAQDVAFYNNQLALAAIMGGHFDLNRSAHWVFRVTPDAVLTRYSINYGNKITQTDINFAISVGVEYKFSKKR